MKKLLSILTIIIFFNLNAQEEYGEFLDNAIEAAAKYDVENYNINLKYFVTAIERKDVTPETLPEMFYNKYLQCVFTSQLYKIEMPEEFKNSIYQFAKYGADKGNPDAMYVLARAYLDGTGIEQNKEKGLQWLNQAGEKGSPEAMYLLGTFYRFGAHLEKNTEKADYWGNKALNALLTRAEKENEQNDLTLIWICNSFQNQQNWEEAKKWAEKTAKRGNVVGMTQFGFILKQTNENDKAKEWLQKACNANFKDACLLK